MTMGRTSEETGYMGMYAFDDFLYISDQTCIVFAIFYTHKKRYVYF